MAAPPLTNTYEGGGGVSGGTISVANSGGVGVNAFDNIQGTLAKYSTSAAKSGSMGQEIVDSAVTTQVRWTALGSLTTNLYVRQYLWISATGFASGSCGFCYGYDSGGLGAAGLSVQNTTGVMAGRLANGNAAAGSIGSVQVPANQWIRVEARFLASATAGEIEWKWWSSPESTGTPTETLNATGLVLGANIDRIGYGLQATNPPTPFTIRMDDVAVSTTGWIGPSVTGNDFSNTVVPTVTGTLNVGGTLTANPGTWTPTPGSFSYYWHRADDAAATNLVEITGATGGTYTLASADLNKYIRAGVIPNP